MKNFPITDPITGQIHWISRSVAVNGIISIYEENEHKEVDDFVLMVKRGVGCPDEVGKWCLPCGYLDYNESGEECVNREVFEETGIKLEANKWFIKNVSTEPNNPKQNVALTYIYNTLSGKHNMEFFFKSRDDERLKFHERTGGEPNEIDEVKWVNLKELDNYDIAFNHRELIEIYA